MVSEVKVSSKYQVVIPKEAREKMGLDKGDTLIVNVEDDILTMRRRPESFMEYGRGLHRATRTSTWRNCGQSGSGDARAGRLATVGLDSMCFIYH